MSRSTLAGIVLALSLCTPALADEIAPGSEPVTTPTAPAAPVEEPAPMQRAADDAAADSSVSHDGRSAVEAWHDTRGWRYGTDMLFPFTRGMADAGITGWARWPTAVLSVPLDLALLPTGILAGLFGG